MKIRKILPILIIALFVCSTTADAQRRRSRRKKVEKVEETVQQKLYKTMLPSTQLIMFVDSIDAPKDDFLKYINLPHDIGNITTYSEFFSKPDSLGCYGFINGFENKGYFSIPKGNTMKLYTAEKLDKKWKNIREVSELNNLLDSINHPYLMADGMTLYFSAKSQEKSLGGYDIFVTRFDAESGTFLEPENIGLPFNSYGNDYMYVVDDVNKIGWFVTDRNKTNGHVTIYTFVPNDIRTNYDIEALGEEVVNEFAQIKEFKKTWTSEAERNSILNKIRSASRYGSGKKNVSSMRFAINNNTVYTSPNRFKSKQARAMYDKLVNYEKRIESIENELKEKRVKYHVSPESTRSKMAPGILKLEKTFEDLLAETAQLRKDIINEENKTINKKG